MRDVFKTGCHIPCRYRKCVVLGPMEFALGAYFSLYLWMTSTNRPDRDPSLSLESGNTNLKQIGKIFFQLSKILQFCDNHKMHGEL